MSGWSLKKLFVRSSFDVAVRDSYLATVAQARDPGFYRDWQVPDSPIGRFDVIALHAFLVLRRMKHESTSQKFAEAFCETLFDDMDRNLREMGVGDLSVGKKVRKLAEGFFGRAAAYEQALAGDEADLHDALRRNLYADAAPDAETLAKVADYVRRCATALAAQDIDSLLEGRLVFAPLAQDSE